MTGKELAALRRRAGLSQAALARRIGVSRQTVSYWEGKPDLNGQAATLEKIADQLIPEDAIRLRFSRPGLGFVSLLFAGRVSQQDMQLVFHAMKVRREILTSLKRRVCNAKTRKGFPCQLKSEPGKKRCRFHGGLSTGPKTVEGRARIATAQRLRWQRKREEED